MCPVMRGVMEDSYALPSYCYGDPARVAESNERKELGCSLCVSHSYSFNKAVCTDLRNEGQKGFPKIGCRCKWFTERS